MAAAVAGGGGGRPANGSAGGLGRIVAAASGPQASGVESDLNMAGYLLKRSDTLRRWNRRWCNLDLSKGHIEYRVNKIDPTPRGHVLLDGLTGATISPVNFHGAPEYDNCCIYVSIGGGKKEHFLAADTPATAQAWVAAIKQVVQALRTHEASMRALSGEQRRPHIPESAIMAVPTLSPKPSDSQRRTRTPGPPTPVREDPSPSATADVQQLQQELQQAREDAAMAQAAASQAATAADKAARVCRDLERQRGEAAGAADLARAEAATLRATVAAIKEELASSQSARKKLEIEVQTLQEQLQEAQKLMRSLKDRPSHSDYRRVMEEFQSLHAEAEELRRNRDGAVRMLEEREKTASRAMAQAVEMAESAQAAQEAAVKSAEHHAAEQLEKQAAHYEALLTEARQERAQTSDLHDHDQRVGALQAEVEALKQEVMLANQAKAAAAEVAARARADMVSLQEERNEVLRRLSAHVQDGSAREAEDDAVVEGMQHLQLQEPAPSEPDEKGGAEE
eukprot:jgi/Chlat1/4990/Chrsp32S04968